MFSYNEIYKKFNISQTRQKVGVKAIINELINLNLCKQTNQNLIMKNDELFEKIMQTFNLSYTFFDISYNNKDSINNFSKYIVNSIVNETPIDFVAIFCPGYEGDGYKLKAGTTTKEKLYKLSEIKQSFIKLNLTCNFHCLYADVFLENYNEVKYPNVFKELEINKKCFLEEANKYFKNSEIQFLSNIDEFKGENFKIGFIDNEVLNCIDEKTMKVFNESNKNFYLKLNWTIEEITNRSNKVATIYVLMSKYILNTYKNGIYLPMENMYKRTKIFEFNNITCLYLFNKEK